MYTLLNDPLWWHWMAFGLILVVAEIVVPSFVIIWFGLAAIVVSLIDWFWRISLGMQLLWWILFSVLFLYIWFKIYKPKTKTKAGQDNEAVGARGIVTESIVPPGRGRVVFKTPVLGSSEWVATADEQIEKGDTVINIQTLGNMLKVKKI